jgi:SSS family solute:Na+ symporter
MAVKIVLALIYLAIVFYLAYKGWRETRAASDYLLAGRSMNPYVMAMSYGATFISTSAIIGFGGAAGAFGFPLLWLTFLNIFVGVFIAMVVFGKRTRRMGIALDSHTFPELMGRRYQSRFVQGFSGLVIFFFIPIYAAAVLIGISRMLEASVVEILVNNFGYAATPALSATVFNVALLCFSLILAIYVITGGLKAVMYTDAFQASIMLLMMLFLIYFTYSKLGGIIDAHTSLTSLAEYMPRIYQRSGLVGWTQGARFPSPMWLMIYTTIIYGVGIGVLAQPQLAVRFMTVKSDRELHRAVLFGGIFILVMTGGAFVVGALSNVVFFKTYGWLSVDGALEHMAKAAGLFTEQSGNNTVTPAISYVMGHGNLDAIIPAYIERIMPNWFAVLFLLAMFAAAMSTLSSHYHVGGTSLGRDFYEMSLKRSGSGRGIAVTRLGVGLTILFTLLWGYVLPTSVIAIATAFFFGLCAASFLPAYFLGLFWKGMTKAGAVVSMVGGFGISFFFLVFVHQREAVALNLSQTLFGKPTLVRGTGLGFLELVDPNIIALPAAVVLAIVVSLATAKFNQDHIDHCWKHI